MQNQNHRIFKVALPNAALQDTLSKKLGICRVTAQILANRGFTGADEAKKFLEADLKHLLDPFSFSQMQQAVELIKKAQKTKAKVMLFGDYDVDGITAVAILKSTLIKMGLDVIHYIPHRINEGYGLNRQAVNFAKEKKIKLLITVDCGTSSHVEIKALKNAGIEVIVTDHHEPAVKEKPGADALINPKLKESTYAYRDLSGVGVAYKLAQALTGKTCFEDLDLVTLGTIADVVPLTGENRVIVKEGLKKFGKTSRPGLVALIESSRIGDKAITPQFISYILGPRLNASGRMDTAEAALNLIMSTDKVEADILAKTLEGYNRQRQKIEGQIMEEAQDLIDREVNFKEHRVIVVAKDDWHRGVLGIVASKLADRFYRPTVVISMDKDICKGSARSIKNFHLFQALVECQDLLGTFGGHQHAAGLTIKRDSISDFKNRINRLAAEKLNFEDLFPRIEIDAELNLADISEKLIEELKFLEPHGVGNPEPLFCTRNLKTKGEPQALGRDTLKFWVTDGDITHQAIGFGMGRLKESFIAAESFDLVYTPRMDTWQEEHQMILEIKDVSFK